MKRSGIARGTTRMRRGRMKSSNPERKKKAFPKDYGPLADHIRGLGCCICGVDAYFTQACHVKTRGACNHAWLDNGDGNLIPMCGTHHDWQHSHGWNALVLEDGDGEKGEGQALALVHAKMLGEEFLADGGERY